MIEFTPFSIPFLAGNDNPNVVKVYTFEPRTPLRLGPGGGLYIHLNEVASIDQGGNRISTHGFYGIPSHSVYPDQKMLEDAPSTISSRGDYFNVSGFTGLGLDQPCSAMASYGKSEEQETELGLDNGAQIFTSSGNYFESPEVFGMGFNPKCGIRFGSLGACVLIQFNTSNTEYGASNCSSRGEFSFQLGVDTAMASQTVIASRGQFQEAIGLILTENPGSITTNSNGVYADATLNPFSKSRNGTTISARGQSMSGERWTENNLERITEDGQVRFVE